MKRRIGDRRGRARFEIVGSLSGTIETWRRFELHNLGAGGALVETSVPFAPGASLSGRLALRGHGRDVRGEVRHSTTLAARDEGMRYLVGVQWDATTSMDDLLAMEPLRQVQTSIRQGGDRRASVRVAAGGVATLGQPHWSTVELLDVSTLGVLFAAPTALEVGDRGELRVRLGDRSFIGQIEVRRSDARRSLNATYRMGAAFVSLDESNRLHLEDFIGDARR